MVVFIRAQFAMSCLQSQSEDVHVFGHTHLTVDLVLDGQRYLQWALGTPREQAAMSRAVGDTGMLVLHLGGDLSLF